MIKRLDRELINFLVEKFWLKNNIYNKPSAILNQMPRGWLVPPEYRTSIMIRNILLNRGQASPYEVWQTIKRRCEEAGYRPPTYLSIATAFWILRKLGLIELTKRAPSSKRGWLKRSLFRIVPGKENAREWENPRLALYDPEKFKRTRTTRKPLVTYETFPLDEMIESRNLREQLARARRRRKP